MFASVLVSSCSKEEIGADMPYITFRVAEVDAETKSLMTNETLNSSTTSVTVYGIKNNKDQIFNGVKIKKQSDSYNWQPTTSSPKWVSGSSYSFYGYTYSGTCQVDKEGLKITVSQPQTYSESAMVDYLLSHAYKVADGKNNHIVMLYMQHAMACAEIVVKQQIPEHLITLNEITLKGIYTSATMECEDQANANSGENNVWKTQISGSNETVNYSKTYTAADKQNSTLGTMTILAVPQQLTQTTKLSVTYSVDEDNNETTPPTQHTDVFNLFNYIPYVWEAGHKVRYTLNINTGVELNAEIVDWIEAGYIEGVILPPKQ